MRATAHVSINSFGFSPFIDGLLAGAQEDGVVAFHDIPTNKIIHKVKEHTAAARALCFSPISKLLLISVGMDK